MGEIFNWIWLIITHQSVSENGRRDSQHDLYELSKEDFDCSSFTLNWRWFDNMRIQAAAVLNVCVKESANRLNLLSLKVYKRKEFMTRALIVLLSSAYIYYSEFLTKQYLYYISKKSCPILYSEKLYENAQDFLIIQYV